MSALPPKADVCGANRHVRYGPKADILVVKALNYAPVWRMKPQLTYVNGYLARHTIIGRVSATQAKRGNNYAHS